jgi:hypothetical protein
MQTVMYRYRFAPTVLFEQFEATLWLALLATTCVHGPAQVGLEAKLAINGTKRSCAIDASTPVGRDLNRRFAELVRARFASDAVTVERLTLEVVA